MYSVATRSNQSAKDILMHLSSIDSSRVFSMTSNYSTFFHPILPFCSPRSPHHVTVCYKRRSASGSFGSRAFCATLRIYPHHALRDPISRYTHAIIPSDPLDIYCWWHCLWQHRSQQLMTEKVLLRSNFFSIFSLHYFYANSFIILIFYFYILIFYFLYFFCYIIFLSLRYLFLE